MYEKLKQIVEKHKAKFSPETLKYVIRFVDVLARHSIADARSILQIEYARTHTKEVYKSLLKEIAELYNEKKEKTNG